MKPDPDPPIIHGEHTFKVEAVLSKTGGVNALAKRPEIMQKAAEIALDHRATVPQDPMGPPHKVRLDEIPPEDTTRQGPALQVQIDTLHRERFDDPSRRLRTNQRIKLTVPAFEQPASQATAAPALSLPMVSAQDHHTSTAPQQQDKLAIAKEHRFDISERIEKIKSTNDQLEKKLESLEKALPSKPTGIP
jgi:hypothetical protein